MEADEAVLVQRPSPGQDAQAAEPRPQRFVRDCIELVTVHDRAWHVEQPGGRCHGASGVDAVARHHLDVNPGPAALGERLVYVVAQRVLDGHEAHEDETGLDGLFQRGEVRGPVTREQGVAESQNAHGLARGVRQLGPELGAVGRGHRALCTAGCGESSGPLE